MSPIEKTRVSKRYIARIQISGAVEALLQESWICSITLAGAAEEICGKIAKSKVGWNMAESFAQYDLKIQEFMGWPRAVMPVQINTNNRARNELKHNSRGLNHHVEFDFKYEAEEILMRAIKNYLLAFDCLPRDPLVRAWYDDFTR
ncbi:MAG: hypothetical protein K8R88_05070 [Armatimonadetes bacterium]|nr:hypothetical protein [Armatimonadota bacterium]